MTPLIYRTIRLFWPGGMATRRKLQELEKNQWLSPDALKDYQLTQLQRLVQHAYTQTTFYHNLYKSQDIHPNDIKSLDDFQRLPTVTKEQIRANTNNMIARNVDKKQLVENHTGGSTGEPLHFYITDDFWWENAANEFRVRQWYGLKEGDKWAWLWGDQRDMPDWSWTRRLKSRLMNQRFLNAFSLTEPKMQAFAEMLVQWQPKIIMGYSTTLALFAQFVKAKGITGIRPRIIEATAEKLWQPQRELIEEVFQCEVIDYYSSREMGLMAYQCDHKNQHILEDLRYIEIIADDKVVTDESLGAVAVTSFGHLAMPFIRYKNGDMAISRSDRCPCGRSLSLMKEIVGRTNDYLVTTDGQFVHSEFFAYLLRAKPEVFSYQIHQPHKAQLNIKVVCNQPVSKAWIENVRQEIQTRFGQSMQLSLEIVDDIELTPSGKHRYIISEVVPHFK